MIYLFIILMAVIIACLIYDAMDRKLTVSRAFVMNHPEFTKLIKATSCAGRAQCDLACDMITVTLKIHEFQRVAEAVMKMQKRDAKNKIILHEHPFAHAFRAATKRGSMKRYRSFKSIRRDYERTT